MKNKRNENIEMLRGLAILMMLFYHYIQSIPGLMPNKLELTILNEAVGAISLALFYTISGYGSFLLFESTGNMKYKEFIKRRCLGIMPHYYLAWGITFLLIKPVAFGGWPLSGLVSELLFVQNYLPETATLNGVTWTIALMMQFYLIAPFMYRLIKKKPYVSTLLLVVVSIIFARIGCAWVTQNELSGIWLVAVSMRWLPSNIGVFAIGMLAASCKRKLNCSNRIKTIALLGCLLLMVLGFYKLVFLVGGTYGDGYRYVIREPLMAAGAAICLWLASQLDFKYQSLGGKVIQFIAKNQYGIYLWHMILFGCFTMSTVYITHYQKYPLIMMVLVTIMAIVVGTISTQLVKSKSYINIFKKMLRIPLMKEEN